MRHQVDIQVYQYKYIVAFRTERFEKLFGRVADAMWDHLELT